MNVAGADYIRILVSSLLLYCCDEMRKIHYFGSQFWRVVDLYFHIERVPIMVGKALR